MAMAISAARAIAGTLGYPSKMPGTSYGIPAANCKTGRKLAQVEGSVCRICYAYDRGNYQYSSVQKSQEKRLASITHDRWVEAMVFSLERAHGRHAGKRYGRNPKTGKRLSRHHRWHDSGDLQSRDHLSKICAVARATPWLDHWMPSKEGMLLVQYVRDGGIIPSNLKIRLSGTMIDGGAPKAWPLTSTVHAKTEGIGHRCPAPTQGNSCGACRACWDASIPNISYHVH
jgi:hypothetical protein